VKELVLENIEITLHEFANVLVI